MTVFLAVASSRDKEETVSVLAIHEQMKAGSEDSPSQLFATKRTFDKRTHLRPSSTVLSQRFSKAQY
jgi:hypothetical protein